jgi:hypothetical protein
MFNERGFTIAVLIAIGCGALIVFYSFGLADPDSTLYRQIERERNERMLEESYPPPKYNLPTERLH